MRESLIMWNYQLNCFSFQPTSTADIQDSSYMETWTSKLTKFNKYLQRKYFEQIEVINMRYLDIK